MLSNRIEPKDKLININPDVAIGYKASTQSLSLRVVVITNNKNKFAEFYSQLSDGYGVDVTQWKCEANLDLNNEQTLNEMLLDIMKHQATSPHFILREETTLISQKSYEDLTNLPLAELAKRKLESLVHTSSLNVYKPQWTNAATDQKKLTGFTARKYEKRSYGYITPDERSLHCKQGFGWDAIFVNSAVNITNEEFFDKYGKKSARQYTISDFIENYLRYKALKALKHHNLPITRPVDFGANFVSVAKFIQNEQHIANPYNNDWLIQQLRVAMLNQGLFFKAAWSRPVKNYFSPPFSGLPLTEKKDKAEETIFMTHDMLHHLICDLICDAETSKENFYIYSAWRMMSEASTLVLADMLYADGLIKNGVDRSCVDKRIYPLFEAIKTVQQISDPQQLSIPDKITFIKKLLSANVRYALLGDDNEWKQLLTNSYGEMEVEHFNRLEAYKAHFGKFFIGDNAWTRANFDNMHANKLSLDQWIANIDKDTFRNANIPLLSDVRKELDEQNIQLSHYENLIAPLFEYMFNAMINPHLENTDAILEDDAILQSRAFRRFLIGQCTLFSRYPTPLNLDHIKNSILARLSDDTPFSAHEQDVIRLQLEQYILGIEGMRLMSREEALNAIDCTPVFPAVYISYPQMQKQYGSIERVVKERIANYGETLNAAGHGLFAKSSPAAEAKETVVTPTVGSLY